jgi:NADH dehydrogenase/NADH:ubiquinone oxidoreductase subunit G
MLTPIRLDSKDGEIIRVLPQFKNNQEWITDKSRFFYDGIKLNRLKNPLKKQKNWEEISWESLILDLKNIFKKVSPSNICLILGNSLDTETLLSAKLFAENFGIKKIIRDSSLKINFDFLTNYNFELETIKNSDCCLLVGTNPRVEVNLINLTLQQLTNKKNLEIFYIGTPFQSTYNENLFKCLGLNINELINLLEGKSSICKKFKNSNNPIIIYGSGLEERKDFFEIKNIIQNINKNTKFYSSKQINLLTSTSNQNGNLNLGILPFSPEIVENTMLYYFVSPSKEFLDYFELILKNKNNFFKNKYIIFQDSYFPQNKINFPIKKSFLIPGKTFVEKKGTFFNIENKSVKILNKIKTTFNSRDDWQIFQIFLSNNPNQIFSYEKIQLELLKLIPNNNVKQYIFENLFVFKSSKFSKIYFKPIINDFYLTHVIANSSKILNKCSIFYRKLATNYSFLKV